MKKTEITINLNKYESLIEHENFSKNIDIISKKLNINKDILLCYILNEGDISDIIKGVELIRVDYNNRIFKLLFEDNISFKEDIIKTDLLYNISTYCSLNNFSNYEYFEFGNKQIFNTNNDLFNKKICLEIDENYYTKDSLKYKVNLLIDVNKERDLFPKNKSIAELEEHNENAFYKIEEYLDDKLFNVINRYAHIPLEIKLTNSLKDNITIIKTIIEKEFKKHEEEIKIIKNWCHVFFENNVNDKED